MISWPRLLSGLAVSVGLLADGAVIAQPILEDQVLVPQALTPDSGYGVAIDSEQDIAVVGANAQDTPARGSGAAYVYQRINGDWVEQQMLTASNGVAGDQFGRSVAVQGTTLFIAAPTGGIGQGQVYVFELEDDTWVEHQRLTASDGKAGRPFGFSIDVSGDILVMGDHRAPGGGAAYVFEFNGTSWNEVSKLVPSGNDSSDRYGAAVATNATHIMVGAPGDDDTGRLSGAIYVYSKDGTSWAFQKKLFASAPNQDNNFGSAIAMHGTSAMSNAPGDAGSVGLVSFFKQVGTDWTDDGFVLEPPMPTNGWFGESISLLHNRAVIGRTDVKNGAGNAFIYSRTDEGWMLEDKLNASTRAAGDAFGRSVSVSTHGIFVGADGDDDAGLGSGAAFVYDIQTRSDCLADTNQDGQLTMDDFNDWLTAFNNQLPWCDQNGDGSCTPTDFTAWISNYNAGCP
jgi:hypothetical protein